MLLSFGIQDVEGASTPTSPDFFQVTTDPTPFNVTKYQKATGALTWVSRERPDIAMAVNHMSSFNYSPSISRLILSLGSGNICHGTNPLICSLSTRIS